MDMHLAATLLPLVYRLMYKNQNCCCSLGNHDYFLRITSLNRKNVVAIFSVWSRGDFQHKMYRNMKNPRKKLILITSKANNPPKKSKVTLEVGGWVGPGLTLILLLENRPNIVL